MIDAPIMILNIALYDVIQRLLLHFAMQFGNTNDKIDTKTNCCIFSNYSNYFTMRYFETLFILSLFAVLLVLLITTTKMTCHVDENRYFLHVDIAKLYKDGSHGSETINLYSFNIFQNVLLISFFWISNGTIRKYGAVTLSLPKLFATHKENKQSFEIKHDLTGGVHRYHYTV